MVFSQVEQAHTTRNQFKRRHESVSADRLVSNYAGGGYRHSVETLSRQTVRRLSLWDYNENALTPQFKRLAALQGDFLLQGPTRRSLLSAIGGKQDTYAYSERVPALLIRPNQLTLSLHSIQTVEKHSIRHRIVPRVRSGSE